MPVMRDSGRPLGVVYTPREVAGAMVELAIGPLVRDATAAQILDLRVCDPAIGEGVFLLETVRVLTAALVAARVHEGVGQSDVGEARRSIVEHCIAGVDVDPCAVDAARAALGACDAALRVADALALDWAAAFPEVQARGGFDVVIGNPPYVRQEHLRGKRGLRAFASYHGVADLYVYFIELAHRLLRPGGRYCLIVPNKWLTVAYARPLRTFLAQQRSVDGIVDLSRARVFDDADAFPAIVWGTAGRTGATEEIVAERPPAGTDVGEALRAASTPQARARWGSEPWHIESSSEQGLLEQLERRWPRLGDVISGRASRGVVTGCNKAFVLDRATRDRIVEEEPASAALIRPFVKGRDVRRWRAAASERWIVMTDRGTSLDELPVLRAHLARFREALEPRPADWVGPWRGRKPGAYAWHELQDPVGPLVKARAPRLLYQDIQTAPACCLEQGEVVPDTTVWMLPTEDRVVLAVLNSPLYGWYARRRFPPALNGAVRPKLEYLRGLPLAVPGADERRAIEALVEQQLAEPSTVTDDEIARAVCEVYELTAAQRRVIATP